MENWIISSTVLILMIMALRFLLKGKISLRLQYSLWFFVLVRLLFPFSIGETKVSIGNQLDQIIEVKEDTGIWTYENIYVEKNGNEISALEEKENDKDEIGHLFVEGKLQNEKTDEDRGILKKLWAIGGITVAVWFFGTNLRFRQQLRKNRRVLEVEEDVWRVCKKKLPIYISDNIETPCLFGLFHPAIYVTEESVKEQELLYHVIVHETVHYLHRDYIWGYLRVFCLAVHWYHPLVWCAAVLSQMDAELACDEETMLYLGEDKRSSYGKTLIRLSCENTTTVLRGAVTMAANGKSMKKRISFLVKKPKTTAVAGILVVLAVVFAVLYTFTGADTSPKEISHVSYDVISTYDKVTDKNMIQQALNLVTEETAFIIKLDTELPNTEVVYEINGAEYLLVDEADSWAYYEEAAKTYYADSYIKETFTPWYTEDGRIFLEKDGNLYRCISDGIGSIPNTETIELWQTKDNLYYVTIQFESDMEGDMRTFVLRIAEDKKYGFEILEKPMIE